MAIGIEAVLFLLGGIFLAFILVLAFGKGSGTARSRSMSGAAVIRLERQVKPQVGARGNATADQRSGHPHPHSSEGVRLADYADDVEQLETVATRIAAALGVSVELARLNAKGSEVEERVPVRKLPRNQQGGVSQ